MKARLKSVPSPDKPLDMADDIYAKDKAKIASIDWAAVHIRGDRAPPISLSDRVRQIVRR